MFPIKKIINSGNFWSLAKICDRRRKFGGTSQKDCRWWMFKGFWDSEGRKRTVQLHDELVIRKLYALSFDGSIKNEIKRNSSNWWSILKIFQPTLWSDLFLWIKRRATALRLKLNNRQSWRPCTKTKKNEVIVFFGMPNGSFKEFP